MKNIIIMILVFTMLGLCIGCEKEQEVKPFVPAEPICCETNQSIDEDCIVLECFEYEEEKVITREERIKEVIGVWELFFKDGNAPLDDPRRAYFEEYAGYVIDAVDKHKDQLHGYKNMDILVATFITIESSVTKGKVGKRGEVGLMQTMGVALGGYKVEEVHNDPELSIFVGTNYLVRIAEQYCPGSVYDDDWIGAVTVYSYAPEYSLTNGVCNKLPIAKEKINLVKRYRWRLNNP